MKITRSPTKKNKPLPRKTKKKAFDIHSYDKYIVSFSGGKDSTACFLFLLEMGVPKSKIELWHQDIDGREKTFFDWEITADYCRKFAKAFGENCGAA